jgi:hypothetical protein
MCPCVNVTPPRVARCRSCSNVVQHHRSPDWPDGRENPSSIVFGEARAYVDDGGSSTAGSTVECAIARLGYTDYSVVDDLFTMPRPTKPADEPAARQYIPQY